MKYSIDEASGSARITELGSDEFYGRAVGELMQTASSVFCNGWSFAGELDKLGVSTGILAEAWDIGEEDIRAQAEGQTPVGWDAGKALEDIAMPLERITVKALSEPMDMNKCARGLIHTLTDPWTRRVSERQLSFETIAKYGGVTPEAVERFYNGEDCLTERETANLCVALLIVDRELNYKARRRYYWTPEEQVS
jgi:hypothetical protein